MQPSGPPDKAALRTGLRAARRTRTPQQRAQDAAALARAAVAADVVLLPAAGGAGGRPLLVAVVHGREVLAVGALPREAHDAPVDAALTPADLVLLGNRGHRWTRPGTTAEHDGSRR